MKLWIKRLLRASVLLLVVALLVSFWVHVVPKWFKAHLRAGHILIPSPVIAQVFENPCDGGYKPVTYLQFRNSQTGNLKNNACVDDFGNVYSLTSSGATAYASVQLGSDFGQKVNNCILALPPDGGTCDATGLTGAQKMASTLTISKSNLRLLLPPTGTSAITSSANPIIQVSASNVEILGFGNSTTAVRPTATTFRANSTNQMLIVGDAAANYRGIRIAGLRLDGNLTSTLGMRVRGKGPSFGVGYSKFERLELVQYNGPCIDLTDGNTSQLTFDHIRCVTAVGKGFAGVANNFYHGAIGIYNSLAQGVTGSPGIGWEIGAGEYVLNNVDGELNVIGFRASSNSVNICNGCRAEGNTSIGFHSNMDANGTLVVSGWCSSADRLPIQIDGNPGASTLLINPLSLATTGPNSIVVTERARGSNILIGGHLDKPISRAVGSNLQVLSGTQLSLGAGVDFTTLNRLTPPNGTMMFCTDCNATCTAGSSTGRTCFRENGTWTH